VEKKISKVYLRLGKDRSDDLQNALLNDSFFEKLLSDGHIWLK